jgi:hypothetical protein
MLATAVLALPTGVAFGKPKPKPPTYKTGTYSAKLGPEMTKFNFTLKRASCVVAPGQAKSSLHLCVALPVSPVADCTVPINFETAIGSFVAPVTAPAAFPGGAPTPGQSSFSVAFTKKGTASGYVELNLQITFGLQVAPCSTGKIPFTAKLG